MQQFDALGHRFLEAQEARDSQLLFNEPKYIRMDEDGIHTLESAGLKMKAGVYY